ncbi:MAG: hypothetical protein ACK6AD_02240 [Cyanobacteriota bacterium]
MGQLTDTLRATLRDLAQSDARLYRGLQEELGVNTPTTGPPAARIEGDAAASREELEGLSVAALWSLCKARGIKGLSKGPVPKQVDALLSHPEGPPQRSTLPLKATPGSHRTKSSAVGGRAATKGNAADLQALEQRLDRLEQLVLLLAQQVGVSPEAIERLLPLASREA